MIFLTIGEVAERMRVDRSTVYLWIREGDLGCVKRGSRWTRVTEAQLEEFAEKSAIPAGRVK